MFVLQILLIFQDIKMFLRVPQFRGWGIVLLLKKTQNDCNCETFRWTVSEMQNSGYWTKKMEERWSSFERRIIDNPNIVFHCAIHKKCNTHIYKMAPGAFKNTRPLENMRVLSAWVPRVHWLHCINVSRPTTFTKQHISTSTLWCCRGYWWGITESERSRG